MSETYLGDIELTDETLAHYGVPGMKWGVRRYDNNRVSRVRNITGSASPVRRASTGNRDMSYNAQRRAITSATSSSGGTGSTVRKPVSGGTGTRDDMENGAIMIFPEELRKPDLNDITKRGC